MVATTSDEREGDEVDKLDPQRAGYRPRRTQQEAAERLGLSLRQVERLARALREHGPPGLVSRKRGRRVHIAPSRTLSSYSVAASRRARTPTSRRVLLRGTVAPEASSACSPR